VIKTLLEELSAFVVCCFEAVSLSIPSWPQTVALPASASQVLGLEVYTNTPGFRNICF
jgi:hypothetical protein